MLNIIHFLILKIHITNQKFWFSQFPILCIFYLLYQLSSHLVSFYYHDTLLFLFLLNVAIIKGDLLAININFLLIYLFEVFPLSFSTLAFQSYPEYDYLKLNPIFFILCRLYLIILSIFYNRALESLYLLVYFLQ